MRMESDMDGLRLDDIHVSGMLREIAADNSESFEELLAAFHRAIYSIAYSICRDLQRSEDIFQETMLYIWSHAEQGSGHVNPKGWILLIARHIAIDMARKNRDGISIETFQNKTQPDSLVSEKDTDARITIRMGLDRLDDLESQVFVLKKIAGLRYGEIADMLQITYRGTRYRYKNAVSKLRVFLTE